MLPLSTVTGRYQPSWGRTATATRLATAAATKTRRPRTPILRSRTLASYLLAATRCVPTKS